MKTVEKHALLALLSLACALLAPCAEAAVAITVTSKNAAGVGFNDPTPVAPVGGNTGTTLGQQRMNAVTYAANLWGATLNSNVRITIDALFTTALACNATGAVLANSGPTQVFRDPSGVTLPKANTYYPYPLANKLFGQDVMATPATQVVANINMGLGGPNCLAGAFFYLGLDGNHGSGIDLVAVMLHEFGHGMGFGTYTDGSNGRQFGATIFAPTGGFPSIWDHFLFGTVTGKFWKDMTPAQRVASAISVDKLVWNGPMLTAAAPQVLRQGSAGVAISGSAAGTLAGVHAAGEAEFGASLITPLTAGVLPVLGTTAADSAANGLGLGCDPITGNNAKAIKANIALLSRGGTCSFVVKVKNAQDAGAIGVLIADNVAGAPLGMTGVDPSVTIPAVRISLDDGTALLAKLSSRSRTGSGIVATIGLFGNTLAGTDSLFRLKMYAPSPFLSGSSVLHFDTSATRNLLMEPAINVDLTQSLIPPIDLTYVLLQEIGW